MAQEALAPRTESHQSHMSHAKSAQEALAPRTESHQSHMSHAKSLVYIGTPMEQPQGLSMVNSRVSTQ